jgi:hypothetical protein
MNIILVVKSVANLFTAFVVSNGELFQHTLKNHTCESKHFKSYATRSYLIKTNLWSSVTRFSVDEGDFGAGH